MVASKSIVRKDVPPFIRVGREPIRYCGINRVALERYNFTQFQYDSISQSYYLIYKSKLSLIEALKNLDKQIPDCLEKEMILSFIQSSNRGIVKRSFSFS